MPNRVVFNDVANNLKIQVYGDEADVPLNVDAQGNVNITGNLSISVTTPLAITGTLGLSDNTVVGITGQPTLVVGGHKFTEIDQTKNIPSAGQTKIYTDGIDVLPYGKYSYYVSPGLTPSAPITVQQQIATTNNPDNFIDSPMTAVTVANNSGALANARTCMEYSRLAITLNPSCTGTITILFQGNS